MNLDELRTVQSKERRKDSLQHLRDSFYEDVAAYMAACDVLIMPWNQSDWIEACNPVKLKEYLAVGRPIVSTPFPELAAYGDHVAVAANATDFAAAISQGLQQPPSPVIQRARVEHQDWQTKATEVWNAVQGHSLNTAPAREAQASS